MRGSSTQPHDALTVETLVTLEELLENIRTLDRGWKANRVDTVAREPAILRDAALRHSVVATRCQ